MREPKNPGELKDRLNAAKTRFEKRNQMIQLSREMYELVRDRKSTFLGADANEWRSSVATEYWKSSNRPQNVVDIMTAVLGGNDPQFQAAIPGAAGKTVASRAEKFIAGVFQTNSRRQQLDIYRDIIFRTVLDGGVGIRTYWAGNTRKQSVETQPNPHDEQGEPWVVETYKRNELPIVIETIHLDKLLPIGRGTLGRPFDELIHLESRTAADVAYEWEGSDDVNLSFLNDLSEQQMHEKEEEYVQWWGQKPDGEVWYAVMFKGVFVKEPAPIDYPMIPYVITTFKHYDDTNPALQRLPFLYPVFWAIGADEYVSSRNFRMIDMYSNMPPIYQGNGSLQLSGTWGEIANMKPDEKLIFPQWPGNPPDMYRMLDELRNEQSQGTFSEAMFGQQSSRMSGYGLSQLIGSDTARTDTPRSNLELALATVAENIFSLLGIFSRQTHIAVTVRVANKNLAAMLSGEEAELLTIAVVVQPKQMADQARLAALGAQLSSLPNPPVSEAFILEKYFNVTQPEDEQERKMEETVMKDPILRMMAIHQVLVDNGSPWASFIEKQLSEAIQKAGGGSNAALPPEGIAGVGLGLPQAVGGNLPIIPPSGNPVEETGPDRQTLMNGGPIDDLI